MNPRQWFFQIPPSPFLPTPHPSKKKKNKKKTEKQKTTTNSRSSVGSASQSRMRGGIWGWRNEGGERPAARDSVCVGAGGDGGGVGGRQVAVGCYDLAGEGLHHAGTQLGLGQSGKKWHGWNEPCQAFISESPMGPLQNINNKRKKEKEKHQQQKKKRKAWKKYKKKRKASTKTKRKEKHQQKQTNGACMWRVQQRSKHLHKPKQQQQMPYTTWYLFLSPLSIIISPAVWSYPPPPFHISLVFDLISSPFRISPA